LAGGKWWWWCKAWHAHGGCGGSDGRLRFGACKRARNHLLLRSRVCRRTFWCGLRDKHRRHDTRACRWLVDAPATSTSSLRIHAACVVRIALCFPSCCRGRRDELVLLIVRLLGCSSKHASEHRRRSEAKRWGRTRARGLHSRLEVVVDIDASKHRLRPSPLGRGGASKNNVFVLNEKTNDSLEE
jgi:hypothetical protein